MSEHLDIAAEVADALDSGRPAVALESSVVESALIRIAELTETQWFRRTSL